MCLNHHICYSSGSDAAVCIEIPWGVVSIFQGRRREPGLADELHVKIKDANFSFVK